MAFKIEFSEEAEADLDAIYQWTKAQWSKKQAQRYLSGLRGSIQKLAENPYLHPVYHDDSQRKREVRQKLYGPGHHQHRILYEIQGSNRIFILLIPHTSRHVDEGSSQRRDL